MNHPPNDRPAGLGAVPRLVLAAARRCRAWRWPVAATRRRPRPPRRWSAKVNKEEISVHQINFALQNQRGIRPEQAEAASRQILERLIDQELALQKAAGTQGRARPRVSCSRSRRRGARSSRALMSRRSAKASPSRAPRTSRSTTTRSPRLFKRTPHLQHPGDRRSRRSRTRSPTLRTQLAAAKSITEFTEWLKANGYRFAGNQAVRGAEQLPLNMVDTFARMKDGQAMLVPTPGGAQVVVLAGSKSEPVDETRARPAIEQFLLNEAKRKVVEADMKALRGAAKIEYVGKFAEGAASAPVAAPEPQAIAEAGGCAAGGRVGRRAERRRHHQGHGPQEMTRKFLDHPTGHAAAGCLRRLWVPRSRRPRLAPEYRLGAGDVVRISVYQNPDLTLETRVGEAGTDQLPAARHGQDRRHDGAAGREDASRTGCATATSSSSRRSA